MLSFLLSVVCLHPFVYSTFLKKINADDLQHINYFSMYSRAMSSNSSHDDVGGDGNDDDSGGFQKLVIMVRDFADVEEYGFGYHDKDRAPLNENGIPNNYFKHMFLSDDRLYVPAENKATKMGICENYQNIGIFLNPHPGLKFEKYPKTTLPDEEFSEKLGDFIEFMISEKELVLKKIGGYEISGEDFIPYVETLSVICKHAKQHFPAAQTIGQSTMMIANEIAVSTAGQFFKNKYNECIDSIVDADDKVLDQKYAVILEEALEVFKRGKTMGGKVIVEMWETRLREYCKVNYENKKELYSKEMKMKQEKDLNKKKSEIDQERIRKLEEDLKLSEQCGKDSRELYEKLLTEIKSQAEREREFKIREEMWHSELKGSQQQISANTLPQWWDMTMQGIDRVPELADTAGKVITGVRGLRKQKEQTVDQSKGLQAIPGDTVKIQSSNGDTPRRIESSRPPARNTPVIAATTSQSRTTRVSMPRFGARRK